jgi:hypothetical protein
MRLLTLPSQPTILERLLGRIEVDWSTVPAGEPSVALTPELIAVPCWRWMGATDSRGFPRLTVRGSERYARRLIYQELVGEIPGDHWVSTRCRHQWCMNPAHLEAVTPLENVLAHDTVIARNWAKEQCVHGHAYTPENTLYTRTTSGVRRRCRQCRAAYRARGKVAA